VLSGSVAIAGLEAFLKWKMTLSPVAITISLAVSGLTGVAFGFLPASRAARLDPIDALRHE
jgi:putative ABC transport system permease protein